VNKLVFLIYHGERACPWALARSNQGATYLLSSLPPTVLSVTLMLERSFGKEKWQAKQEHM